MIIKSEPIVVITKSDSMQRGLIDVHKLEDILFQVLPVYLYEKLLELMLKRKGALDA